MAQRIRFVVHPSVSTIVHHGGSVNVWSHLLGAVIALVMIFTFFLLSQGRHDGQGKLERAGFWAAFTPFYPFSRPAHRTVKWEDAACLLTFLIGCLVCFTCSATFHTSLCHSQDVGSPFIPFSSDRYSKSACTGRTVYEPYRLSRSVS